LWTVFVLNIKLTYSERATQDENSPLSSSYSATLAILSGVSMRQQNARHAKQGRQYKEDEEPK
jgi:hypothetical protein